ncbi:glycosylated lysosomal membrane protein [Dunckerocampus dactyliophorus]|uniref:glycosylated lysosomal membrane protein n=1 Tax=Dunckerocampus dactyliophorus TaxID=161453 RepID=UPI0024057E69|nr:glycosylated lysosomal membrane protein [Dunckerocampus dactyliophorus]
MAAVLRLYGTLIVLLFSAVSVSDASTRKLSVQLNPGAVAPPTGGDLLHVRAEGHNDTLHFLLCSQGAPTLLLVHTNDSSSSVSVNWPLFLSRNASGSLQVEPASSILSSAALVFSRLLEYNDINNTAEVTSDLFSPYELHNVSWSRMQLSGASARLCGAVAGGSVCVHLSVFESEGRAEMWPRLLHTANSSQIEVWLDSLSPRAARSRFLLELQAVGGAYALNRVEVHRSIDDEFTPSIFKVSQWLSADDDSSHGQGFVLWKPVAYRHLLPALEDATPCRHSDPRPLEGEAVAAVSGLVRAFFTKEEAYGLNVSFGLAGQPFYNSTKFLSWTALVGVGLAPADTFSPLVLTIMAVGLGTPLVILMMGGVYVGTRRRLASLATSYEPIN